MTAQDARADLFGSVERELPQRARGDLGCKSVAVREIGTGAYEATGCRKRATYICVTRPEPLCALQTIDRGSMRPKLEPTGHAERKFDEKRSVHTVHGTFTFPDNGVAVVLAGAPQVELTGVHIKVQTRGSVQALRDCDKLEILINGEPFGGMHSKSEFMQKQWATKIEGRFQFQVFKPLAKPYARFGLRACGYNLELTETQVDALRKFLVLFSQIAQEVQARDIEPSSLATDRI